MNYYVLVEGERGAKALYADWISRINPRMRQVTSIQAVSNDHFYIVAGYGYPEYFEIIRNAVLDVNANAAFDRLAIAVDSEEMTYKDKLNEIASFCSTLGCRTPIKIVIQHYCLESWALGNRKLLRSRAKSDPLKTYKTFYNVSVNDPELMGSIDPQEMNRAQFAFHYLYAAFHDKNKHYNYRKNDPRALMNPKYFDELRSRLVDTGHISSFSDFADAFL